ncbi:DUF262 domain-containing protein [Fusobacterium necrophorum]|uniref:DUF262 domain-containing protein n=1 Tax=Fusobacterium necrophorum TaxID=859 RepID=UPI000787769E|nr:DUF262 domain-containing protein [Fusobacterium necrophorum]KYM46082.1 hypothetical protein A2U08_09745 [Fusobacterium necrophorum subsp. funduliforme]
MNTKRYNRKATSVTISVFYENYQLNKYNMDPPYQRDYNVWEVEQKSFLIDSIFKNFPIPPIFLEQKIDTDTGKTRYDVIDGKQRLSTIAAFIDGKINLPNTFGNDEYGYSKLNGKNFTEIKELANSDEKVANFVVDFWSYTISIEYIERPDVKIVDNIFDRLNREGTRLNPAELRKAKYYDSHLYSAISELREDKYFKELLKKLNKNRLQDVSFITEVVLLVYKNKIIDGVENVIDETFDEIVDEIDEQTKKYIIDEVRVLEEIVKTFNLDFEKYYINGVSHLYAIFYMAYYLYKNKLTDDICIEDKLVSFYTDLRGNKNNEYVKSYHSSMQSASKYKYSRKKRIKALLDYFNFSCNYDEL